MRRPVLVGLVAAAGLGWAGSAVADEREVAGCLTPEIDKGLVRLVSSNGAMTAVVRPEAGGELVGLESRAQGDAIRELLYRGMNFCEAKGWDGKAPVLWPATGRSFAPDPGFWMWQGQRLPMPIHGFARDKPWKVVGRPESGTVALRLIDDADTRARYPFGFVFDLTYRLSDDRLTVEHVVTASPANDGPMPFSIGNHMTFAVDPDARIVTPAGGRLPLNEDGRPLAGFEAIASPDGDAVRDWLGQGATSLVKYPHGRRWLRLEQSGKPALAITHWSDTEPDGEAVSFNLWGKPGAGYFSPEPWVGRQDSLNSGVGLFRLAPGQSVTWTIEIALCDTDNSRQTAACRARPAEGIRPAGESG